VCPFVIFSTKTDGMKIAKLYVYDKEVLLGLSRDEFQGHIAVK
jgi:hypothetical protein